MDRAPLEAAEVKAKELGRALKNNMPDGWGFTLILYNYNGEGFMTYLSSGQREDCIKMMEELLLKITNNERNV